MTATSEQSWKPFWKGRGNGTGGDKGQTFPRSLQNTQSWPGWRDKPSECPFPSSDPCPLPVDLRRTTPSARVHLNMIKQPLGRCSWEMEIYRLPNLHLNANAAFSPGTGNGSGVNCTVFSAWATSDCSKSIPEGLESGQEKTGPWCRALFFYVHRCLRHLL